MHSDQNASPPRVEVITSVQRRRRWPTAEKIRLVEETMQPGMSVSYVARRAGVAPSLLFNWRRRMLEGGLQAVQADEDVVGTSRVRELERRVRELERLLGRKTMEDLPRRQTKNCKTCPRSDESLSSANLNSTQPIKGIGDPRRRAVETCSRPTHQVRQLGDVRRNAPSFVPERAGAITMNCNGNGTEPSRPPG